MFDPRSIVVSSSAPSSWRFLAHSSSLPFWLFTFPIGLRRWLLFVVKVLVDDVEICCVACCFALVSPDVRTPL
jgi:hypothetical protein